MNSVKEQRVCIKFCYNPGKTASETHKMIRHAFGDQAIGQTACFKWFAKFQSGHESFEDDQRSGRPSTCASEKNVEKISVTIEKDRRQAIRDVAKATNLSFRSCQSVLTKTLGMRRRAAKFVPRLLTAEQKQQRINICKSLKRSLNRDRNLLSKIIAGDETWIFGYDPETKNQSSQWKFPGSPRPMKCRQVKSKIKSMLIVFYDHRGIVHREFVPEGQTVNQHFYLDVLRRLREDVRRKRPELWASGDWHLLHDNAPPHVAAKVQQFITSTNMNIIQHPPYSPDLSPCDYFLFPRMKIDLKGKRFESIDDVKKASQKALQGIPEKLFHDSIYRLQDRWNRCIDAGGDYFEGFHEE